jgi:guanylate kinase
MKFVPRYDYVVVNDNVARAAATVEAVLVAERARSARYRGFGFGGGMTEDDERAAP